MKLRSKAEDFIVEETCAIKLEPHGHYGLYRLGKRGLTTPEAVRRVAIAAGVEPGKIRFCGLKDRHAITQQTITIQGEDVGPLKGQGFELRPLGRAVRSARSTEIIGNTFTLVLRDLSSEEAEACLPRASAYAKTGIPNFFDDQRFGSARSTGRFPAEALCRGDAEAALKLVIGTWSREDSPEVKKNRRLIAEHWRDWTALKGKLGRSSERSIITYLEYHAEDFVGAFDRMPESLRGIILAAFQSLIWNETLSEVIRKRTAKTWEYHGRYDDVLFFDSTRDAAAPLDGLMIPMAHRSAKAKDADVKLALDNALSRRDLAPASFKLPGFKKTYFWRGERAAVAGVGQFHADGPADDEINKGRFCVKFSFQLPPGAYATMFVKAAMGPQDNPPAKRRPQGEQETA